MIKVIKNKEAKKVRGLLIGSPNTGKTSFLETIKDERVAVLSFPDEKGIKSIPIQDNIESFTFEIDPLPEGASTQDRYKASMEKELAISTLTNSILKGDYGHFDIFFGDGLSKYYELCLDIVSRGKYLEGNPFDTEGAFTTRLYGNAHVRFRNYLSLVYSSSIPISLFTCWEKLGYEDENISDKDKRDNLRVGNRVWLPALPGQMANLSTGEFDFVVRTGFTNTPLCDMCKAFASNTNKDIQALVQKGEHHTLQLQPKNDVQCVGIKGIRKRYIPTFIHQEWSYLKGYVV
jgi:hypothetical protein